MAHQTFFKSDIRPAALARQDRRKALEAQDDKDSDTVKVRSGGQCEVFVLITPPAYGRKCQRRAVHVHHMLGGNGVRARGESAKAIRKQHVCAACHTAIGNHTLVRIGGFDPHYTDAYRRVK